MRIGLFVLAHEPTESTNFQIKRHFNCKTIYFHSFESFPNQKLLQTLETRAPTLPSMSKIEHIAFNLVSERNALLCTELYFDRFIIVFHLVDVQLSNKEKPDTSHRNHFASRVMNRRKELKGIKSNEAREFFL